VLAQEIIYPLRRLFACSLPTYWKVSMTDWASTTDQFKTRHGTYPELLDQGILNRLNWNTGTRAHQGALEFDVAIVELDVASAGETEGALSLDRA
jgi:hypothetical protein